MNLVFTAAPAKIQLGSHRLYMRKPLIGDASLAYASGDAHIALRGISVRAVITLAKARRYASAHAWLAS
jgi:hypothetical protein